jgi:WD40 repeat protein
MTSREERVNAAVAAYLEAAEAGKAPERGEFLARFPDVAAELDAFIADREKFAQAARALEAPAAAAGAESPTLPPAAPASADPTLGTVRYFGDYELLEEIARGGMGVVYRARQTSLNRIVALKMILTGQLASAEDVQRFRIEAEAAANLDHPNIVPIYEVGDCEGQHYFSMKLVEGGSLATLRRSVESPTLLRSVAKMVAAVARAVHYAHQRGILHRDLKPANVLLDRDGQPQVTDFGLAKRVEGDSGLTQSGAIVGTPSYMAPEQARAVKTLTTAVDVYSLGAILYELLTGQPPFRAATALDTLLQVIEREPEPPRKVHPQADAELATMALKCLEKDPAKRYGSAEALADDLERWLRGEPILARPTGTIERAWKWAKRRPAVAALSAGSLLLLTVALATACTLLVLLRAALQDANDQRRTAAARADAEAAARAEAQDAQQLAEQREQEARRLLYSADVNLAQQAWEAPNLRRVQDLLDGHRPQPGQSDLRGFEWGHLWYLAHGEWQRLRGSLAAIAPDGKTLAARTEGWSVTLYELPTGRVRAALPIRSGAPITGLAFAPTGSFLAIRNWYGVALWDPATAQKPRLLENVPYNRSGIAFTSDGRTLAWANMLWDVATGTLVAQLDGFRGDIFVVAFSPDGRTLATGGEFEGKGRVTLWDVATRKPLGNLRRKTTSAALGKAGPESLCVGAVTAVAFAPDGRRVAVGFGVSEGNAAGEAVVALYDAATRQELAQLPGHTGAVTALAFAPDGRTLASSSHDTAVRLWDVAQFRERAVLKGHQGAVESVAYTTDGGMLVTAGRDEVVKIWDARPEAERNTLAGHRGGTTGVAFTPDGRSFATGGHDGAIQLRDTASGEALAVLTSPRRGRVNSLAFTRDGRLLAAASNDGARLWDVAARKVQIELRGPDFAANCLACSPDGRLVAVGYADPFKPVVIVWETATGRRLTVLEGPAHTTASLAFTPDGKLLATGWGNPEHLVSTQREVRLWDTEAQQVRAVWAGLPGAPTHMAFSPDGTLLALGTVDYRDAASAEVALWDVAAGTRRFVLRGHKAFVWQVAFTPDGRTLATASHDKTVKLWDPLTGRERLTLWGHTGPVFCVAFAPDGRTLATGSGAPTEFQGDRHRGEVRLWRSAAPAEAERPRQ